uniref:Uncharacterized protein n=1 Tax=Triticum aestivum TaxID=4565 RepID=F5CPR0_WHEAT|nr:hypothetical protein TAANSRALLhA_246G5.g00002 [Triticum aestivum]
MAFRDHSLCAWNSVICNGFLPRCRPSIQQQQASTANLTSAADGSRNENFRTPAARTAHCPAELARVEHLRHLISRTGLNGILPAALLLNTTASASSRSPAATSLAPSRLWELGAVGDGVEQKLFTAVSPCKEWKGRELLDVRKIEGAGWSSSWIRFLVCVPANLARSSFPKLILIFAGGESRLRLVGSREEFTDTEQQDTAPLRSQVHTGRRLSANGEEERTRGN